MFRVLKKTVLLLLLAALVAVGVVLLRSSDPLYVLQSWVTYPRFWKYDALIIEVSKKHGVDPMLIKALIWRETKFRANQVGTSGERGLMQITEGAAQDWARMNKIEGFKPETLFEPRVNIEIGTWYLRQALKKWEQKSDPVPFALAGYNAGHTRVSRWVDETNRGEQATAQDLKESIDFPGTRHYVDSILHRYEYYKQQGRM